MLRVFSVNNKKTGGNPLQDCPQIGIAIAYSAGMKEGISPVDTTIPDT